MNDPSNSAFDRRRFDREVGRERGIIAQSNARSAAIAQALSAVWAATGIVAAIVLPRPQVEMTTLSTAFGIAGLLCFAVQLAAAAAILWPRGLADLPNDSDEAAYLRRLISEATTEEDNAGRPSKSELREGFLLQRIRRTKEYATQVTLLGVLVYVPVAAAFFATLNY